MTHGKGWTWAALGMCAWLAGCTPTGEPAAAIAGRPPAFFGGPGKLFGGQTKPAGRVIHSGPLRAVWVTRFAYRTPADIAQVMDNCQGLGLNAVLFQVRGNGTVFYRSRIEPWSEAFGGGDPGFDPLEVAVREAHARGLELHAWVNVMPGWRGPNPPQDPRQLYNARPEWFWYDQKGRRQPLIQMIEGRREGWYVSLNPCLPEVRQYLVSVFEEIARGYAIDGLHLDYIRLPNDNAPRGVDYPHDPRTLALYREATGRAPADSRAIWDQWRTEQVSRLVYETRVMVRRVNPEITVSAAVNPDPVRAKAAYFQDGEMWAAKDWVDYLLPMNYTDDEATFVQRAQAWRRRAHGKAVVMGIGLHMTGTAHNAVRQIELADRWKGGFSLFTYSSLFAPPGGMGSADNGNGSPAQRGERLAAVRRPLLRIAGR